MKKYLLCTFCTLAIGVGSLSAQSNKAQVSKKETAKVPLEKVERPQGEVIILQPITKTKNVDAIRKETIIIAEPKKQSKQNNK